MNVDPIKAAVATILTLRAHDELKAMEVLPNEAALLERVRRHADEFQLVVKVIRRFVQEHEVEE